MGQFCLVQKLVTLTISCKFFHQPGSRSGSALLILIPRRVSSEPSQAWNSLYVALDGSLFPIND